MLFSTWYFAARALESALVPLGVVHHVFDLVGWPGDQILDFVLFISLLWSFDLVLPFALIVLAIWHFERLSCFSAFLLFAMLLVPCTKLFLFSSLLP